MKAMYISRPRPPVKGELKGWAVVDHDGKVFGIFSLECRANSYQREQIKQGSVVPFTVTDGYVRNGGPN